MPEHGPGAIGGGSLTMLMKYLFLAFLDGHKKESRMGAET